MKDAQGRSSEIFWAFLKGEGCQAIEEPDTAAIRELGWEGSDIDGRPKDGAEGEEGGHQWPDFGTSF